MKRLIDRFHGQELNGTKRMTFAAFGSLSVAKPRQPDAGGQRNGENRKSL
jgi:hypothetical protein